MMSVKEQFFPCNNSHTFFHFTHGRTIMRSMLIVLLICGSAHAQSTKEKTEYNKSLAAVMGGWSQLKEAGATVLKAQGEYLEQMAQIRGINEDVRAKHLTNDMLHAQNFYAKKQLYEQYKEETRTAKPNLPTQNRSASLQIRKPLVCPVILRNKYTDSVTRLSQLMLSRTSSDSGIGSSNYEDIKTTIDSLLVQLKDDMDEIPPMDYIEAKKFLEELDNEAKKPYIMKTA